MMMSGGGTAASGTSTSNSGAKHQGIPGQRTYSCANCRSPVADHNDVISTAFQGRNGRAYLFCSVENVSVGQKEDRHLMTGLHAVADISCRQCQEILGWKYERAYEQSQKYKEGKFVPLWIGD